MLRDSSGQVIKPMAIQIEGKVSSPYSTVKVGTVMVAVTDVNDGCRQKRIEIEYDCGP